VTWAGRRRLASGASSQSCSRACRQREAAVEARSRLQLAAAVVIAERLVHAQAPVGPAMVEAEARQSERRRRAVATAASAASP
jgi:hypothetical protein